MIFYSEKPELFILPSGALFISESLLERVLKIKGDSGLECLSYLLLKELVHLIEGHLQANIQEAQKYGDLRRQLFFFQNEYTGYDALFIDHFTNTRYTLQQEERSDELTFQIAERMGLLQGKMDSEAYREVLKAV